MLVRTSLLTDFCS